MGIPAGDEEQWQAYFDVEQYGEACGLCRDTGTDWYDYDMTAGYKAGQSIAVEDIVLEIPYSEQFEAELLSACHSHGVHTASYSMAIMDFHGTAVPGQTYFGLTFVGAFRYQD